MMALAGARNTRGFSNYLQQKKLPPPSHITYQGIFNELKFDVGDKTKLPVDLHIGYSRYQFIDSQYDSNINDYLALFLKSEKDGQQRDSTPMNCIILLDVSGSMNGPLGSTHQVKENHKNRLQLSIQAIKMLISRLRKDDSIGFITFNDLAHVVFKPTMKSQFDSNFYDKMQDIRANGGTTIVNGFKSAVNQMNIFLAEHQTRRKCQNRIVMLTDVCDDSFKKDQKLIEATAQKDGINLTIIGISNQFKSETCECLKDIKGFNYFCAINDQDIKKYVFETFDFGFFQVASNVQIDISSQDVESFEVYGTADSDKVSSYNDNFKGNPTSFVVTKIKSAFPSEIYIENGKVFTVGGLILLKLNKKSKDSQSFKATINLKCLTSQEKQFLKSYQINYKFHPKQQFFSDASLMQALQGYTFASQMKNILQHRDQIKTRQQKDKFLAMMKPLQNIAPKSKLKDLQNIVKILKENQQGNKQ